MTKEKNCLTCSMEAGLRWCGINDRVPYSNCSDDIIIFCYRYSLQYQTNGNYSIEGNEPVIVVYKPDNFEEKQTYHAVFASDAAPFARWPIQGIVTGWSKLRSKARDPLWRLLTLFGCGW